MNTPQTFTEALMHARNVAYVLKHSVGESQALIVSLNSGILDEALKELERAHKAELGKAGGQPAHPSDHASDTNSLSDEDFLIGGHGTQHERRCALAAIKARALFAPPAPSAIAPDAAQPPFSSPVRNRLAYLENVDFDHFKAWAKANGWEPDTSPESENWTLPAWWHPGNMRRKREDWLMDDYKDYLWAPFINETVKS